jgi:hypothetical protein
MIRKSATLPSSPIAAVDLTFLIVWKTKTGLRLATGTTDTSGGAAESREFDFRFFAFIQFILVKQ